MAPRAEHAVIRALLCPYCAHEMEAMQMGSHHVNVCISCGTRWFDRAGLSTMVASGPRESVTGWREARDPDEVSAICPRCRTDTLQPYRFGPVGFRRCGTCGGVAVPSQNLDAMLKAATEPGSRLADVVRDLFDS
jgi:Zn-finger nucleic acid-binding protein